MVILVLLYDKVEPEFDTRVCAPVVPAISVRPVITLETRNQTPVTLVIPLRGITYQINVQSRLAAPDPYSPRALPARSHRRAPTIG